LSSPIESAVQIVCYDYCMTKNIVLIGGSPAAGKSTLAAGVAMHLGVPWISTDQVRDIMRGVANRRDFPLLFNPEGYSAERFLTEFSAQQISDMEFNQGEAVWPAVIRFINDDYTWKNGFVVEGVSILPHLVAKDLKDKQSIKSVFVIDQDPQSIREVVFSRGLWGPADSYSDDVKEKEVEWTLVFGSRIKNEAAKYNLPCVVTNKSEGDLGAVINALAL
jgi:2-phosphoglycerate kinase